MIRGWYEQWTKIIRPKEENNFDPRIYDDFTGEVVGICDEETPTWDVVVGKFPSKMILGEDPKTVAQV